ncbi:MAG: type II toxin-antitoxin system VapC family toxin [Deinococcota bacterium]
MILDTSAVLAVLLHEAEAEIFADHIADAAYVGIASPTLVETGIVLGNRLGFTTSLLDRFLQKAEVDIVSFGELHWQMAVTAYDAYGKGRHPASLNFGDCFSYSSAKLANEPLLCKGSDFVKTDLELVGIYP